MKKKIILLGFISFLVATIIVAQESDKNPTIKKEEKIIIKKIGKDKKNEKIIVEVDDEKVKINGENYNTDSKNSKISKEKKITILVDGDNVTINGKPAGDLTEKDIEILKGKTDHLGSIAPHLKRLRMGRTPPLPPGMRNFNYEFDTDMNTDMNIDIESQINKALLGVVTENDDKGAKISSITDESGAKKAGLTKGDIISKINDYKIANSDDLVKAIGKHNPEDKVTITYLRDGVVKTTIAVLGKNDSVKERIFKWNDNDYGNMEMFQGSEGANNFKGYYFNSKPKIGIKIQDVEEGVGVKVLSVDENTPASKAGLIKDDIITEINGDAIKTVDDIKEKTTNIKEGNIYKVKILRNGVSQTIDIKFPKKLKTANL